MKILKSTGIVWPAPPLGLTGEAIRLNSKGSGMRIQSPGV